MTTTELFIVEVVDRLIEERNLLKHPSYQAWQRGDLTLDAFWSFLDGVYKAPLATGAAG